MEDGAVEQNIQNKVVRVCTGMAIGGLVAWRAVMYFRGLDPMLAGCPTAVATLTYRLVLRGLVEGAFAAGGLGLVWDAVRTTGGLRFKPYVKGLFRLTVAVSLVSTLGRLVSLGLGMLWSGGLDPVDALAGWRPVQIVTLAVTALFIPWAVKQMEDMVAAVAQKSLGLRILSYVLPALAVAVLQLLLHGLLEVMTPPDRDEKEESDPPPTEYRLSDDEWGEAKG